MCRFCETYNFGNVGYDFAYGETNPTIYFPGRVGNVPEGERFKFCPVCGERLTQKHFADRKKEGETE